jgi:hypothetical protein
VRTRRQLALSLAVAATLAGLCTSTASADESPQNFVLVSNHDIGVGKPAVHIEEHATDGAVIGKTSPSSGTHYWYVNANTAYLTVRKGERTFVTPPQGTINQATDLPVCYRVTNSGELHYVQDQPCRMEGTEGTWE